MSCDGGTAHNGANLRIIRRRLRHVISCAGIINVVRDLARLPKLLLPHYIHPNLLIMVKAVVLGAAGTLDDVQTILRSHYVAGGIGQPLALLLKANPLVTEVRVEVVYIKSDSLKSPIAGSLRYRQHPRSRCRSFPYCDTSQSGGISAP